MTNSSVSVSAETLKQLNAKFDELSTLLNSLTAVAETKSEPELVITYHDTAKTKKFQEYYTLNRKFHGKYIQYFENGNTLFAANYVNGAPHGICVDYNKDGSVQQVRKYNNGILNSILFAPHS